MRIVGDETETYTYGALLTQLRAVAFRLGVEGVAFGDRVALIAENHPCWASAYLGTLYHGAICVPIDPHGETDTIVNFLKNSEAKVVFLSPDMTEKFAEIRGKLGREIKAVFWRLEDDAVDCDHFEDWLQTAVPEEFAKEIPPAAGDDIALLMYTSGTTGTPKGVPLSHANIIAELDGINHVLKLSETDKILSLLPLFHAYLQIVNLWIAVTYGCEVGYLKELSPDELGRAMRSFSPTILTTVPRLWYLFHKKIFDAVAEKPAPVRMLFRAMLAINGAARTAGLNPGLKFFAKVHESFGGKLRFAVTAGSRFDEDVAIDFHRLGFTILQGYGLTETSGAATATYASDNRVGSVGKPFVNAEVKIDEADDKGEGEVLIRGAMVFKGYYNNPTATAEVFTSDGWFRSGDLGRLDSDGHLYIVGRKKDVIVLPNGKNVHPEDLEVHYLKSPYVEELAIIGVDDASAGRAGAEKLVAIVVPDFNYLKTAKIANSQAAIRFDLDTLGRDLPEYQRVREYIVRAEPLPRTATRKIKRFQLRKAIIEGNVLDGGAGAPEKLWDFTAADAALAESKFGAPVFGVIKRAQKEEFPIHPSMNLEIDLGLDSLARAELFAALESAFGVEFDGDEAANALTVRDVVGLLEKNVGADGVMPVGDASLNWSKIIENTTDDLPEVQPILVDRPIFRTFAFCVYKVFNLFCRVFMRLEVCGRENLTSLRRPFIICPNHQSFLDPFVLTSNYDYGNFVNIFHVGASEFFESRFMGWVARMLQVVPVDPDTQLMKAMKAGAIGLRHGRVLNIYPEGERGFDGDLHEFKKGAAILATELELPILPVALDGLHKVWARASMKIRPAKVKIRFGTPFYARDVAGPEVPAEERYELVIAHLKSEIAAMIEEMRKV